MRKYIRIGVDIAKNSFQVHALESEDCSATKRKLSRSGIVKFLAEVEPCAIGMEACGSAHYWARRFRDRRRPGFQLVPWRPALEQRLRQQVSGVMTASGVEWDFRRRGLGL